MNAIFEKKLILKRGDSLSRYVLGNEFSSHLKKRTLDYGCLTLIVGACDYFRVSLLYNFPLSEAYIILCFACRTSQITNDHFSTLH